MQSQPLNQAEADEPCEEIQKKALADILSEARKQSSRERAVDNMVISSQVTGIPFSQATIPKSERVPIIPQAMLPVLNWSDGKRSVLEAVRLYEIDSKSAVSEESLKDIMRFLLLLERHSYLKLDYRLKLNRRKLIKQIRGLGIRQKDKIVVHVALSGIGYIDGGAETLCRAFMETVGSEGVVVMPSFNFFNVAKYRDKFDRVYDPSKTPTLNGIVADTFWRMDGVRRSLNPSHPFAVWGHEAEKYTDNHHRHTTFGAGSPLALLEEEGGKAVLVDCFYANSFHHTVEMTNHVPCLKERAIKLPVRLPNGTIAEHTTWGWRKISCPVTDSAAYIKPMCEAGVCVQGYIGKAPVLVFKLGECRKIIESMLQGTGGCRNYSATCED